MSKKKFLDSLKNKLTILEKNEVNNIIAEYSNYIDEKMENGQTEQEAVASFGNIDLLVTEILKSYKINVKQNKDIINNISDKLINTIEIFFNMLKDKEPKEIMQIIIELLLLFIMLGIFHLPISLLEQLGKSVFYILSNPINQLFYIIWNFILEIIYFALVVVFTIRFISKRYLTPSFEKQSKKTKTPVVDDNLKTKKSIVKIMVILGKFMAICLLFGLSIYLIVMGLILGICVYLLINKVTYIGLYLIMLVLFILGALFFKILFSFVIDKPLKGKKLLIEFVVTFIFLGIGSFLALFDLAQTSFINKPSQNLERETLTEEIPFEEEMPLLGNISNFVVDESLNNVQVVYEYYSNGTKIRTNIWKNRDGIHLDWQLDSFHLESKLIKQIIKDLQEKKIYNYYLNPQVTIKANQKNILAIKTLRQKYYHALSHYSSCEFIRTYKVINIQNDKNMEYVYLTIEDEDDVYTVKLKKTLANNVVVGANYEFVFRTYQSYIDTDIEEIFHDAEVISINKTDKIGKEQKQDEYCRVFY